MHIYLNENLPTHVRNIRLDKIESLYLLLSQSVDLSNLPLLDSLKILDVNYYEGKDLIIKNKMQSLEELTIKNSESLKRIDYVLQKNNITFLRLINCKSLKLDTEKNLKKIKHLTLDNSNNFLPNLERIGLFKNLETLFVKNVFVNSIPEGFPKKIKSITIYDSTVSLDVLIQLKKIKSLKTLKIFNSNIEFNDN